MKKLQTDKELEELLNKANAGEIFHAPSGIKYRLNPLGSTETLMLLSQHADLNLNDIFSGKVTSDTADKVISFMKILFEYWIAEPKLDGSTKITFDNMPTRDKDALVIKFRGSKNLKPHEQDLIEKFRKDPDWRDDSETGSSEQDTAAQDN
jgi:hypothetical protein